MKFTSRIASPLAAAIAALLAISYSHAGQIWDGGGGDDNWNTAGNWDSDTLPTFTNAITFTGNVRNGAVNNLTAASTIGGINLTNAGGIGQTNAFTLSGNSITLGGNIVTTASSSAITDTISLAMILNDNRTITTNTNHNLTVSGIISQSGTRSLIKEGAGTLTLSGLSANTYGGGTTVNAGILSLGTGGTGPNTSSVGALGTNTVTLNTGGQVRLWIKNDASFTIANNFTMNGGVLHNEDGNYNMTGAISVPVTSTFSSQWGTKDLTISGAISGAGGVTINNVVTNNGGAVIFSNTGNSYAGATTISASTLQISTTANGGVNSTLGASSNAAANLVLNGGILRYAGIAAGSTDRLFTLNTTGGTIQSTSATAANSLSLTNTGAIAFGGSGARTLTLGGANTGNNVFGAVLGNGSGGATTLQKSDAGTWSLTNTNTYTGGTTLNAGTLNVANVRGLGASGTVNITAAATLRLSTDTAFGGANPVYNMLMFGGGSYTGTIELNRATAGASTGITHNFGLLTITLNGGGAAFLNVTAGANAPTGGAGALDTIAFTSVNAGNNNTVTETLNPTGGNITIGTLTAAGNSLVTMALSGTTAGNAITGVIGGTGNQQLVAISKTGASTWTLSNAGNNYTGGTTFSAGTLVFASGALGTTGAITGSGGTLRWASGNTQDISSRLAMTAATSTFDTNGNNVTFASAIGSSVAAALTKTGSGALTLQGTNTYTGSTTVNLGTLTLDYSTNDTTKLSNTSALVLGGGTVNLAGGSHTEVVSATTLTAGANSFVTRSSGTSVLQMGTITPNTGTVDFGADNIATTNNLNNATTGIIGAWATVGGDLAINSGSATSGGVTVPGVGIANGFIRAYTGYTDVQRLTPGVIPNTSTANVRITEGTGAPGNITLAAATTSVETLNQSISGGTSAATITLAGQTLRTNGILMGPTAGALTIGTSVNSGTLATAALASSSVIVTNNSSNLLTINSVIANISGTHTTSLVKTGTGVLVLTGLNTYTGGTTLQDGTIRVGATQNASFNGILGAQFNTGLTIANKPTAVFDLNNFNAVIKDLSGGGSLGGNVTLGSGNLDIRNPNGLTYSGIISGTGNLTAGDTTTWITTSAHTYSGSTTVRGGSYVATILADGGIPSGIGQSSSVSGNLILTNGILSYNGTSAASTNRQFTLSGNGGLGVQNTGAITWTSTAAITHGTTAAKTFNLAASNTGIGTLAAGITDSGTGANITGITKTGTGTWALTGTGSTFTGTITLNTTTSSAGTLSYASAGATVGVNPITFNQTTSTATLSYIGATDKTMSGLIQANALSTGAITLDASGTGAVNYSNTGSLGVGGASGAKGLVLSGTNTGNNTLAGGWSNNTLGGAATLTKNGAGTWILTNTNGYTGTTTVNLGTLRAGAAAGGQAFGTGSAVTLANAASTSLDLNGFSQTIGSLAGGGTTGGNVTLGANATLTAGGNGTSTTFAGVISGTGTSGLTKTGIGSLILTNANTYAGNTLISTGNIDVRNNSALGGGSVSVTAGAALLVGLNNLTIANNITLNGTTTNGAINVGHPSAGSTVNLTGTLTLNATSNISQTWNDKTLQLSGMITGAGGLDFVPRGTAVGGRFLITGATNDYAGATSVTGTTTPQFGFTPQAMLYLGATNALPTTTALTLNNADLYLNGQSQTLPSISGSGSFSVQNGSTTAATLTLGSGDTTSTFSGTIKDNGLSVTNTASTSPTPPASIVGTVALTKTGNGILTLSGTNLYSGATNVNSGTLELGATGSIATSNSVTIAAGATFDTDAQATYVIPAAQPLAFGINATASGSSGKITADGLNITNAVVSYNITGTPDDPAYVLATYTSLTGASFASVPAPPAGYSLQYAYQGNKIALVQNNTYASWIATFPGVGLLNGVNDDPDNDGIDNGMEMVLGGNPATGMDTALLPTIELVNADPDGDTTFSDYLLFTYRRTAISETALVAAACETDSDLVGPWSTAINGASGVVIQEDLNFTFTPAAPANTDRVRVYVPRGVNTKLFGRLNVMVP
jgi:autotransporter-associated beta strand protein